MFKKSNSSIVFILSLFFYLPSFLFSSIYAVPDTYDNTYSSIKSKSVVIISNTSPISSDSFILAGQNVHFRCVRIAQIPCRGGVTPSITVSVSDLVLLDPNMQLLSIYGYRVWAKVVGSNWDVCGAGVGGFSWDTSELTSRIDEGGNTILDYKYIPNTGSQHYLFFTDAPNRGNNRSHMVIDVQQKCK